MDQNSAHPSFKMDYSPMRKLHQNHGDQSSVARPTSVLSPNAPEFVPQSKQNKLNVHEAFGNLSINSPTTILQQQQQQQQQQQHSNHLQQFHSHHLNYHQQQQQHHHQHQHQPQQNCIPQQQHYNQYHYQHQNSHHNKQVSSQTVPSSVQDRLKVHQQPQPPQQQYNIQMQQNMSSLQNKPSSSSLSFLQSKLNRTEQQQQQYYQHQPRESSSSSSSSVSVVNNCEPSQNMLSEQAEDETFALNYIAEIVDCLSSDPGSFDSIAPRALAVFHGFGENQYVLSNAMEIIFNQSIEEQNFRYMGAKLYGLLDSINPKKDSVFRNLLNLKLNYHRNEIIKYMQNENSKVRGTTLFLAELYMQLRTNVSRVPEIAQNIIFTMKQLLQKHTPENIKCICLTLKLAGYDLEIDCPNDLINIIESLRELEMDVSTSRLLEATLSLHKNNWGRNETINQINYTNNTMIRYSNEPVFYGPDGQVLTEEENSFLEANIQSDIINDDDPDLDEFDLEPGMDAEMEKDYNEFLKNTINHSC